jgi:hypothetical protein
MVLIFPILLVGVSKKEVQLYQVRIRQFTIIFPGVSTDLKSPASGVICAAIV